MLRTFVVLSMLTTDLGARLRREDGATAVEYGLLVTLIALAIIFMVTAVGVRLSTAFERVRDALPT